MSQCVSCQAQEQEGPREVHSFGIVQLEPVPFILDKPFCDNQILTSRYTWWSFLPVSLFELFHQISNLVYAILALLYLFAKGSTDFYAAVFPLSFAVGTAMIKDAVYDVYRQRQDKVVNNRLFSVIKLNQTCDKLSLEDVKSSKLKVGDVVVCKADSEFPCDMLILASSDPRRRIEVTTANLDGETTAKIHYALLQTQKPYLGVYEQCNSSGSVSIRLAQLKSLHLSVECESPNADLHKFEGKIIHPPNGDQPEANKPVENISFDNIVLRGFKLVNTEFMIGMPIYTGRDTKLSLNSKGARRKYTAREAKLNTILGWFVLSALALSIIMSTASTAWDLIIGIPVWILPPMKYTAWEFVQNVFSFSFITSSLLPISLILTIEYQQLLLTRFISRDIELYDEQQDLNTVAKTVHTADELGQIEFLFSDKTGTLTQNTMVLRVCSTIPLNRVYQVQQNAIIPISEWRRNSFQEADQQPPDSTLFRMPNAKRPGENEQLANRSQVTQLPKDVVNIILVAVLCHSIEVQRSNLEGNTSDSLVEKTDFVPVYQASSPDEKALVEASARLGFVLKSTQIDIKENVRQLTVARPELRHSGTEVIAWVEQTYLIDVTLEFDPARKRMTVMARHPDGTFHIHSKGAETAMLSPEACSRSNNQARTHALERVNQFAISGLRTLVLSSRQLAEDEYMSLVRQWRASLNLLGQERATAMDKTRRLIESNLEVVGVTGVEDRLQPGVEDCLRSLREAGIQIWVLTGDKEETAVTVSQASGHFPEEMSLIRLTSCGNFTTTARRILEHLEGLQARREHRKRDSRKSNTESPQGQTPDQVPMNQIDATTDEVNDIVVSMINGDPSNHEVQELRELQIKLMEYATPLRQGGCGLRNRCMRRKHRSKPGASKEAIGLVIDGISLKYALHPALRTVFLDLCMNVTTVLCCRMTPLQKASVVQLVHLGLAESDRLRGRSKSAPVTAAVGDGGNDVAMILQANVGIGIYGKEGLEAVRAADYAVPQFRFLQRLILVHGHWSYHRISSTMLLFYEKGVLFVTVQLLLDFYSGFTSVSWFDTICYVLYKLTMTSLLYMAYGVFEKVFTAQQLLENPHLYHLIANQRNLGAKFVALHVLDGIWQGMVIFFAALLFLHGADSYSPAIFFEPTTNRVHLFDSNLVGAATFVYTALVANVRLLIYVRDFNVAFAIAILITIAFNMTFLLVLQVVASPTSFHYQTYYKLGRSPVFWLSSAVVTFIALFPAIIWRILSDVWLESQLDRSDGTSSKEVDKTISGKHVSSRQQSVSKKTYL